jgi:hypothetical protein
MRCAEFLALTGVPAGSGTRPDPRSSSRPWPRPPGRAEPTGRPDPPPATRRRPGRYGLSVAAGTPATHAVAGTVSRNPECDVDARGPTSCRRSRLRAPQEPGNRCALTTVPAWKLALDLSSVTSPYSRCRTAADIRACLGDPVGNCGSPIGGGMRAGALVVGGIAE